MGVGSGVVVAAGSEGDVEVTAGADVGIDSGSGVSADSEHPLKSNPHTIITVDITSNSLFIFNDPLSEFIVIWSASFIRFSLITS